MDTRDIPLEFARPRDAEAMARLSRDLIETGLGWAWRPERIARSIADAETVALVARDAAHLAGFAIMNIGDERAHLSLLAVRPAQQRRGIARHMLRWLVATAEAAGMASIHVELRASNTPAYALYVALGFEETLREQGYYQGRETAVKMIRVLRAPGVAGERWRPPTFDRR